MTIYRPAPAVERIARELIAKEHSHLSDIDITYLFVDPPAKSKGAMVMGSARIVSGLAAYLIARPGLTAEIADMGVDGTDYSIFVIEIAEIVWSHLEEWQRRALVDHELSHCWAGENERGEFKLATRGHDVEEFQGVIARHGMWKPELKDFATTVEQLTLADRWGTEPKGADA